MFHTNYYDTAAQGQQLVADGSSPSIPPALRLHLAGVGAVGGIGFGSAGSGTFSGAASRAFAPASGSASRFAFRTAGSPRNTHPSSSSAAAAAAAVAGLFPSWVLNRIANVFLRDVAADVSRYNDRLFDLPPLSSSPHSHTTQCKASPGAPGSDWLHWRMDRSTLLMSVRRIPRCSCHCPAHAAAGDADASNSNAGSAVASASAGGAAAPTEAPTLPLSEIAVVLRTLHPDLLHAEALPDLADALCDTAAHHSALALWYHMAPHVFAALFGHTSGQGLLGAVATTITTNSTSSTTSSSSSSNSSSSGSKTETVLAPGEVAGLGWVAAYPGALGLFSPAADSRVLALGATMKASRAAAASTARGATSANGNGAAALAAAVSASASARGAVSGVMGGRASRLTVNDFNLSSSASGSNSGRGLMSGGDGNGAGRGSSGGKNIVGADDSVVTTQSRITVATAFPQPAVSSASSTNPDGALFRAVFHSSPFAPSFPVPDSALPAPSRAALAVAGGDEAATAALVRAGALSPWHAGRAAFAQPALAAPAAHAAPRSQSSSSSSSSISSSDNGESVFGAPLFPASLSAPETSLALLGSGRRPRTAHAPASQQQMTVSSGYSAGGAHAREHALSLSLWSPYLPFFGLDSQDCAVPGITTPAAAGAAHSGSAALVAAGAIPAMPSNGIAGWALTQSGFDAIRSLPASSEERDAYVFLARTALTRYPGYDGRYGTGVPPALTAGAAAALNPAAARARQVTVSCEIAAALTAAALLRVVGDLDDFFGSGPASSAAAGNNFDAATAGWSSVLSGGQGGDNANVIGGSVNGSINATFTNTGVGAGSAAAAAATAAAASATAVVKALSEPILPADSAEFPAPRGLTLALDVAEAAVALPLVRVVPALDTANAIALPSPAHVLAPTNAAASNISSFPAAVASAGVVATNAAVAGAGAGVAGAGYGYSYGNGLRNFGVLTASNSNSAVSAAAALAAANGALGCYAGGGGGGGNGSGTSSSSNSGNGSLLLPLWSCPSLALAEVRAQARHMLAPVAYGTEFLSSAQYSGSNVDAYINSSSAAIAAQSLLPTAPTARDVSLQELFFWHLFSYAQSPALSSLPIFSTHIASALSDRPARAAKHTKIATSFFSPFTIAMHLRNARITWFQSQTAKDLGGMLTTTAGLTSRNIMSNRRLLVLMQERAFAQYELALKRQFEFFFPGSGDVQPWGPQMLATAVEKWCVPYIHSGYLHAGLRKARALIAAAAAAGTTAAASAAAAATAAAAAGDKDNGVAAPLAQSPALTVTWSWALRANLPSPTEVIIAATTLASAAAAAAASAAAAENSRAAAHSYYSGGAGGAVNHRHFAGTGVPLLDGGFSVPGFGYQNSFEQQGYLHGHLDSSEPSRMPSLDLSASAIGSLSSMPGLLARYVFIVNDFYIALFVTAIRGIPLTLCFSLLLAPSIVSGVCLCLHPTRKARSCSTNLSLCSHPLTWAMSTWPLQMLPVWPTVPSTVCLPAFFPLRPLALTLTAGATTAMRQSTL